MLRPQTDKAVPVAFASLDLAPCPGGCLPVLHPLGPRVAGFSRWMSDSPGRAAGGCWVVLAPLGCLGRLWQALAEYLATLRLSFARGAPMHVRSPRRLHSKRDGPSGDLPNCVLEGGPSFGCNEGQSRDGPTGDLRPPGALGPVASRHGRSNQSSQYVVGRPA